MLVKPATLRECELIFRRDLERHGHRFSRYKKRNRFQAAIGFDSTAVSSIQTVASFSFNITIGAGGADRLLVVGVGHTRGPGTTVTGITAGGVAMAFIRSDQTAGNTNRTELWQLANPATGVVSVAVTLAAAPASCVAGAISLTGVDQVAPVDANNGTTGLAGTQPSVSVITVADNAWIVTCVKDNSNELIAVGAGYTQRWNVEDTTDHDSYGGSSKGPVTPAGSTVANWTNFGADWEISAASFKPSVAGQDTVSETLKYNYIG